jgi:hypothetical protein
MQTRTAENHRAEHSVDELCLRQGRQLLRTLERQIEACDTALAELSADGEKLQAQACRAAVLPVGFDSMDSA